MMDWLAQLGKALPDADPLLGQLPLRVLDYATTSMAERYGVRAPDGSWELLLDAGQRILVIFLIPQQFSALPAGLRASMLRDEVRAILGEPARYGEAQTIALLGCQPAWDRFDTADFSLHVSYRPTGGLEKITLMLPECAP